MTVLHWTLIVPLLTALLGVLPLPRWLKETNLIAGLAATFAFSIATAGEFLAGSTPTAFQEALRVDGLSALVLVLSAFVGVLSGAYSVGYLRRNEARGLVSAWRRREFDALVPLYVFAMLLVTVSNNLGILWIAVELTTLVSVFLVAFHNRDTSLEAAWKFLVLGSLGLAFALLGTVLIFASGRGLLGEGMEGLNWTRLVSMAGRLHPLTLKLGVVFAMVGYGTKAGLAPMHTWKPDAYREAPSPAVVLMAVGMLNGALYCLLRFHVISKAALGPGFTGGLLLALGLLSVAVATPFILIQWNVKRLLAYSSIEHVGIMAVGVGLGAEAATFGALLHMTYHTLAKPLAFFSAGTLAQLHSSSDFDDIAPGTLGRTPVASMLFLLAAVIMTGSPPFGLFFSEMTILRAGFAGPHTAAVSVFLACLVLLFCGFFYQVGRLVLGGQPEHPARVPDPERFDAGSATTILAGAVAVVSAFYLPQGLLDLIHAAVRVVETAQ
ncbi:MAG TPA: proton-conducting transporter membrane subunit [Vicinamibacteria bacterium]|nr:proton-conducting transporter membrane subunit [Vicinamibacteria bacterium]